MFSNLKQQDKTRKYPEESTFLRIQLSGQNVAPVERRRSIIPLTFKAPALVLAHAFAGNNKNSV